MKSDIFYLVLLIIGVIITFITTVTSYKNKRKKNFIAGIIMCMIFGGFLTFILLILVYNK
jgi:type IV secretory pathway TrbL component